MSVTRPTFLSLPACELDVVVFDELATAAAAEEDGDVFIENSLRFATMGRKP
jgi:hypothetical protein